ncbi:hypothetical protein Tco_0386582 [Tanacetum coccineum]
MQPAPSLCVERNSSCIPFPNLLDAVSELLSSFSEQVFCMTTKSTFNESTYRWNAGIDLNDVPWFASTSVFPTIVELVLMKNKLKQYFRKESMVQSLHH